MSEISVMGFIGGRSPLVMQVCARNRDFCRKVTVLHGHEEKILNIILFGENFGLKVKNCKNLTKIHFFEILTVFRLWPCFNLFCLLAV